MSRYKTLTKSKREFLEELIRIDGHHNILSGTLYGEIIEILNEKRYLTKDSEWLNERLNEVKDEYFELKKNKR